MLDFFTAPAKNKGVAALEPHHGIAFAHRRDHQLFNERLRGGFAAAALAHIHDAGGRAGKSHDVGADQVIDKQHAGLLDGLQRLEGQQFRVARAGAHQRAAARRYQAVGCKFIMGSGVAGTGLGVWGGGHGRGARGSVGVAASGAACKNAGADVFREIFDESCKRCSTCCAIEAGTGCWPASTARM